MSKKIALISLSTPTPYNNGAASALPYHLAKFRDKSIDLEIYSFNINSISQSIIDESAKELNAKITVIQLPLWYTLMFKLHLLCLRVFLKYPFLAYLKLRKHDIDCITKYNPDAIWIYGEELSGIARQFSNKRCVVTTPDCEAMYYYRELSHRGQFTRYIPLLKNSLMYCKYARMVEDFPIDNIKFHLVGKDDSKFLKNINPNTETYFINHPHYGYSKDKVIGFSQSKIKLLIAGRYDLYMKDKCDEVFDLMLSEVEDLKEYYEITFLGKNWELWQSRLLSVGYEVTHISFVPDYTDELIKHDIQLTPIGVGTGTKGKVLDAFANGLMVIGTLRALENIQVENGVSCILYDNPQDAIMVLKDIPNNKDKYEQMAIKGRDAVLAYHNRQVIATQFFNLFD